MATRKHFTRESRLEAVRLLDQFGKSGAELARQPGARLAQVPEWSVCVNGVMSPNYTIR
jgi:hypothetical protein